MILKSIKWRLQAWQALVLVCVLGGFGVTAYQLQRANQIRHVDQELQQRVSMIITEMRAGRGGGRLREGRPPPRAAREGLPNETSVTASPDGRQDFPPPPRELQLAPEVAGLFGGETNPLYYVVWVRDGSVLKQSSSAADSVPLPPRTASIAETPSRQRGMFREVYHFTPPGECVLVGRSIVGEMAELRRLAWLLTGAGGLVLVLGLAGGAWMAARAMRPIEQISATASRISGGNLAERISVADTDDELGRLAAVLNSTFARLESAFAQQQQFTADASHELRTPISVVLNQTQSALARERPAVEYREALAACQRAAQRMRQLTESLLALARLDAAQEPPKRERFDLARTARECIDLVRPLAADRRLSIETDLAPAECDGDPERLSLVITNLLTNAIQYNQDAGEVRIATRQENGSVILTVADQGPGVPPASLEKIFERFHREDASRNRHTGGVGLGLAIVKSCVEAGGGSITASNVEPHGLTMEVRLPAADELPAKHAN